MDSFPILIQKKYYNFKILQKIYIIFYKLFETRVYLPRNKYYVVLNESLISEYVLIERWLLLSLSYQECFTQMESPSLPGKNISNIYMYVCKYIHVKKFICNCRWGAAANFRPPIIAYAVFVQCMNLTRKLGLCWLSFRLRGSSFLSTFMSNEGYRDRFSSFQHESLSGLRSMVQYFIAIRMVVLFKWHNVSLSDRNLGYPFSPYLQDTVYH